MSDNDEDDAMLSMIRRNFEETQNKRISNLPLMPRLDGFRDKRITEIYPAPPLPEETNDY